MLEQKIEKLLEKDIESLGCFIWGIEISGNSVSKHIVIYIDKNDNLVALEDCERVNIQVREVLENLSDLNFNYSLEVSSPGIDRKFFRINQLKDYLGEMVKVSCFLDGKKCKLKGELKDVSETEISLICQGQIYKILNGDYLSSNLIGTNYE